MSLISPETSAVVVAVTDDLNTTGQFAFFARGGQIILPVDSPIELIEWYASSKKDGVFAKCRDESASEDVVSGSLAAGKCYPIPAALFGCLWLKPVANAAGSITVTLKG